MKLVLYSLAAVGAAHCERQWIVSIRSLRRHSPDIAVRLCVYGVPALATLAEARRLNVEIVRERDYALWLEAIAPGRGRVLAENPTLHKIASMRGLPWGVDQVLYLDCDTFCFQAVEPLFERCAHAHFHAREEPGSRRSAHGYDPACVDEAALEALARRQGVAFVPPYNTGVMMLNGGLWARLAELFPEFLDLVWRLSPDRRDGARSLPFPSANAWIVEEVATWLLLGRFPGLTHAAFDPAEVAQNGEALRRLAARRPPRLAHYFSGFEADFFAALQAATGHAA